VPDHFGDLDRPPLSEASLRRSLVRVGSWWTAVTVLGETGSTNADLVAAAQAGTASPGAVLTAEQQTRGRGRLGRTWASPPRAGLAVSVLVAPAPPPSGWGWLPLLAGLAVVDGLRAAAGIEATLKWPNDVLAPDGRKLAGILAERVDGRGVPSAPGPLGAPGPQGAPGAHLAVVGIGLNATTRAEELPVPTATSLALAGAENTDRQTLLVSVLRALDGRLGEWDDGQVPAAAYRAVSSTLGSGVRVDLPSRAPLEGTAVDLDGEGRLVVQTPDGARTVVAAGDVTHLR
jgi:BirA family biotin operon repressor/biotin-[acetyl-CoA-carboxylase] ligase